MSGGESSWGTGLYGVGCLRKRLVALEHTQRQILSRLADLGVAYSQITQIARLNCLASSGDGSLSLLLRASRNIGSFQC